VYPDRVRILPPEIMFEDQGSVSVTEEVVVEKRPAAKEGVRIRKDVVEDTETLEADARREEADLDKGTTGRTS
jgi:stress response protein YsnF